MQIEQIDDRVRAVLISGGESSSVQIRCQFCDFAFVLIDYLNSIFYVLIIVANQFIRVESLKILDLFFDATIDLIVPAL